MERYKFIGTKLNGQDSFLVNSFVFFTFWSFFTAFPIAFHGFFRTVLGGRLGLLILLAQIIIFGLYAIQHPRCYSVKNQKYALVFSFALIFIWLLKALYVSEFDNGLVSPLFSAAVLILLRDDLKEECLNRFIKVLAVILLLSIIEYLIYILSNKGVLLFSNLERFGADDSFTLQIQLYDQYLFNVVASGTDFPRFQSLCEEPGVIGTICGFLVYATRGREDLKFQYFVFVIAGFLSFSLAFYALFAMHFLTSSKVRGSTLLILALLIVLAYVYLYEFFEYRILFRVQEEGVDNRVTEGFDMAFSKALSNGELWWPHDETMSVGAGAKMWLWRNGIISFIVLFLSYAYYYFGKIKVCKASKKACLVFFLAFWVSFYQRHWITNLDYLLPFLTIPILYANTAKVKRN